MSPERVAIVGSRNYPDLEEVRAYVGTLPLGTVVVSGGARGVDLAAENAAGSYGLRVVSYRPKKIEDVWRIVRMEAEGFGLEQTELPEVFRTFAPAAYFRNGLIVDDCDRLEAFWTGGSPGTRNAIELARKAGKLGGIHKPSPTGTAPLPLLPS